MAASSAQIRRGVRLESETEMVRIPPSLGPEPDPDWTYTDAAGHEHRRVDHGYPSLVVVVDRTYWCEDCRDGYDETHWECPICGEVIEPGTRPASMFVSTIPGPTSWTLTLDEHIYLALPDEIRQRVQNGGGLSFSVTFSGWPAVVSITGGGDLPAWLVEAVSDQ